MEHDLRILLSNALAADHLTHFIEVQQHERRMQPSLPSRFDPMLYNQTTNPGTVPTFFAMKSMKVETRAGTTTDGGRTP